MNVSESTTPRPQVSLWTIFTSYFIVGLTAFGMAIIQKLKAMVLKNGWLNEEEVNEGMAMVQLYPGPLMVDFTAYVGYKLRGVIGAIVATIGYILPTFVFMSVLSIPSPITGLEPVENPGEWRPSGRFVGKSRLIK